jgi:hypothetical protein
MQHMKLETQDQMAQAIAEEIAQREAGHIRPTRRTSWSQNWESWERRQGDVWVLDRSVFINAVMELQQHYIGISSPKAQRRAHYLGMMYGIKRVDSFARRDVRFAPEPLRKNVASAAVTTGSAVALDRATEIPEFEARLSPSGTYLTFRCLHCKADHAHGAAGGYGSRAAHCWRPDSPYRARGYVLVPSRVST